jgi:hypothetical protein
VKCLVKYAIKSSMKTQLWNTKRYYHSSPRIGSIQSTNVSQAFVIHVSHSSISIYYSKLPNSYLSEISRNGVKHSQKSKQGVKLRRTKKYRLRDTEERVELFQLLAKLLWYLISGKSHVGYLFNYEDNPIHKIVYLFCFSTNK